MVVYRVSDWARKRERRGVNLAPAARRSRKSWQRNTSEGYPAMLLGNYRTPDAQHEIEWYGNPKKSD